MSLCAIIKVRFGYYLSCNLCNHFIADTMLEEPFQSFVQACSLCVFAQFSADDEENVSPFKRNAIGKPSEVALLRYMDAFTGDLERYQNKYDRLLEMSFNSKNKCSLKVYSHSDEQLLICIKGEPESLIYRCNLILTGDGLKRFSQSHKSHLLSICNKLGKEKQRLIGLF